MKSLCFTSLFHATFVSVFELQLIFVSTSSCNADVFVCSNVDVHALKREAEFYCITPLSELTLHYHNV